MHPLQWIRNHYRNWVINNFHKSIHGKRLRRLKDLHKGEKCIIVANGPSLIKEDLELITQTGIVTFGMNRIYKVFNETKWRPTYYVVEDPAIINGCCLEINSIPAKLKFIPLQTKWDTGHLFKNTLYFWLNYNEKKYFPYRFSPYIDNHIDCAGTVTFTCITIAAYMGFKEIYLLGVDNNYRVIIDENGQTVVDNSVKDYFCEHYDDDIKDTVVHNMGNNTRVYRLAKAYCQENGIRIFNSTRGGKLEVFERIPLEKAIKDFCL